MSLIEKLPNEVLLYIFDLLTIKDLYCCASVCQRWFSVGICKNKPGYESHDLL